MKNLTKKIKKWFVKLILKIKGIDVDSMYDLVINTKKLEELKHFDSDLSYSEILRREFRGENYAQF